jgi:hypothetical protein
MRKGDALFCIPRGCRRCSVELLPENDALDLDRDLGGHVLVVQILLHGLFSLWVSSHYNPCSICEKLEALFVPLALWLLIP